MRQIRCAIYTRLSKEDEEKQQPESESIQNQKSLLIRYAMEHDWEICHIYCDEDYSGADSLRPDFNRMIRAAREGEFQIILCKSQSRFTRDMELVEKYIHGLFPVWGIRFIAVADNTDTAIKGNKKARQINGLINEWYLEDLSENIRMVFDMKRREGQYIGGVPVYGYRKDPCNKNHLMIDPEAADVVRQIFGWALEGHGKQRIASMLNDCGIPNPARYKAERGWTYNHPGQNEHGLWNKTTVWRILRNEMYVGVMVQGRTKKASYKSKTMISVPEEQWYRVEGTHEAIIDREMFQNVQKMLDLRSRTDGTGDVHPLSGLVRCMDCGSVMSKTSNGRKGEKQAYYLRCKRYADSGKEKRCTRHSVRLDQLMNLVSGYVRHYVQTCCTLEELDIRAEENPGKISLEQKQKKLIAQLKKRNLAFKNLYLDKISGLLTEEQFVELNQTFQSEKGQLERQLEQIDQSMEVEMNVDDTAKKLQELMRFETVPRELFVLLIEKIEIGECDPETGQQSVKIHWKF